MFRDRSGSGPVRSVSGARSNSTAVLRLLLTSLKVELSLTQSAGGYGIYYLVHQNDIVVTWSVASQSGPS